MPRTNVLAKVAVAVGLTLGCGCVYGGSVGWQEPPPGSYSSTTFQVATAAKTIAVSGASISSEFLTATGVRPLLGRAFVPDDFQPRGAPVVMLGYGLWKRGFGGSPEIIGRAIQIDDRQVTVVGIMPEGFALPKDAELWVPRSQ